MTSIRMAFDFLLLLKQNAEKGKRRKLSTEMSWKARFVLLFITADHIFPLISSLVPRLPPTDFLLFPFVFLLLSVRTYTGGKKHASPLPSPSFITRLLILRTRLMNLADILSSLIGHPNKMLRFGIRQFTPTQEHPKLVRDCLGVRQLISLQFQILIIKLH